MSLTSPATGHVLGWGTRTRLSSQTSPLWCILRVGQNRTYAPYMTVHLLISLPKIPYIYRIIMVLANPVHTQLSALIHGRCKCQRAPLLALMRTSRTQLNLTCLSSVELPVQEMLDTKAGATASHSCTLTHAACTHSTYEPQAPLLHTFLLQTCARKQTHTHTQTYTHAYTRTHTCKHVHTAN
jgi:hypothetical protein